MKKCKKCGTPLPARSKFCTECGAKAKSSGGRTALLVVLGLVLIFIAYALLSPEEPERGEDAVPVAALTSGTPTQPSREKFVTLKGDGSDTVTVMLYLVGSNLETDSGCATADLVEIMDAELGDNVRVVVQTGGANQWQNDVVGSGCGRYLITNAGIEQLDSLGMLNMAEPETLSDFISFSAAQFPADRYQLILWNHGGGTISGFGYDEITEDMMSLSQMDDALTAADVKFDLIGFDACLMATVETAYMLEPHADYLVASEESEPGEGWYYTGWLDALGENPSIDTETLGKRIVDDYVSSYDDYAETTLSLVDLTYIAPLYDRLCAFMEGSEQKLTQSADYSTFSNARADAREYGEGGFEQIDVVDYASKTGVEQSDELIGAMQSAVKYRRGSLSKSYGLAMYFPYYSLDSYEDMTGVLSDIGMDGGYTEFFDSFLTILAGGQLTYGSGQSPLSQLVGVSGEDDMLTQEALDEYDWYDSQAEQEYDYDSSYEYNELAIDRKGEDYVLHLSDEEWENIVGIELQVWYDDGEGYLDLGSDSLYEFDDDGDLRLDFDNTWVTINGQTVPFYTQSYEENEDGSWYNYGYVPCFINDEEKQLVLCWTDKAPDGYVVGYREVTYDAQYSAKGVQPLNNGDTIDFIADYYTYDGEYEDWYYLGDTLYYDGSALAVSYEDVGDAPCVVFYMLTDIYQSNYYTEAIEFSY